MEDLKPGDFRMRGVAGEKLVEADLLFRGIHVTKPSVDLGDDLHAKLGGRWVSIQVKTQLVKPNRQSGHVRGRNSRRTGGGKGPRDSPITSEVLAWVNPETFEITYYPPLPPEYRFVDDLLQALKEDTDELRNLRNTRRHADTPRLRRADHPKSGEQFSPRQKGHGVVLQPGLWDPGTK